MRAPLLTAESCSSTLYNLHCAALSATLSIGERCNLEAVGAKLVPKNSDDSSLGGLSRLELQRLVEARANDGPHGARG